MRDTRRQHAVNAIDICMVIPTQGQRDDAWTTRRGIPRLHNYTRALGGKAQHHGTHYHRSRHRLVHRRTPPYMTCSATFPLGQILGGNKPRTPSRLFYSGKNRDVFLGAIRYLGSASFISCKKSGRSTPSINCKTSMRMVVTISSCLHPRSFPL